jgi:hypothetical protein
MEHIFDMVASGLASFLSLFPCKSYEISSPRASIHHSLSESDTAGKLIYRGV